MQGADEENLEGRIDYHFKDRARLRAALIHRSYANEQVDRDLEYNERLEFLGDAVLGLAVSRHIFHAYPQLPEGELTRIRAEVVSENGLAAVARKLAIGESLWLGKGEEKSGGREKASLLADALEAVLGAIFCDGGLEAVTPVIESLFAESIEHSARRLVGVDHKTRLQEFLQARFGCTPVYVPAQTEGPDHQRIYTVEVHFSGKVIGCGRGRTKKAAEQEAASQGLAALGQ